MPTHGRRDCANAIPAIDRTSPTNDKKPDLKGDQRTRPARRAWDLNASSSEMLEALLIGLELSPNEQDHRPRATGSSMKLRRYRGVRCIRLLACEFSSVQPICSGA